MRRREVRWFLGGIVTAGVAAMLLVGGPDAWAGPGSGDEVGKQPSKASLVRRWRFSKARRAQQRRIRELKAKIALLRKVVPELQTTAMREADRQRIWARGYERRRRVFLAKWRKVVRLMGKVPTKLHSDIYARFGISSIWSADTPDWKKCKRRRNNADGDDFYLYANFISPKDLIGKKYYAIEWAVDGYDFNGRMRTLYYHYARTYNYRKFSFTSTNFRRRVTGLGLTPGWYYVRGTIKVRGSYWLRREFYSAVYISRVNPKISAPPPRYRKYTRPRMLKMTKLTVKSRGAAKGQINPKSVYIRGRYQVDKQYTGPDSRLLVGASLYSLGRRSKLTVRQMPIRTAFRFRQKLKRTTGSFGSPDTTRLKNLDAGLRPGNYLLRIWIMVSGKRYQNYWAFEDKTFEIKPLRRLPTRPRR
jgi:hypothetical protein